MRDIVKLGLMLLLITSVAAVVLAMSNNVTSGVISEVEAQASDAARKEVLPQADNFKPLNKDLLNSIIGENNRILDIYTGYSEDDSEVGYAIKTATPGYGGDVEVITGISLDGKITGIKVVRHQETPGLGANATTPEFQEQFIDKSVENEVIVVKSNPGNDNEIQALTGATITSNAVTSGVNIAREIYNSKLSK